MRLRCRVVSLDGRRRAEADRTAPAGEVEPLLEAMQDEITGQGGMEIVADVRDRLQGG